MKCDKCGIEIADDITHCPLCGRALYDGMDEPTNSEFKCYPDNKIWVDTRKLLIKIMFWLAIIGTIISFGVELLLTKKVSFSWYVLTGVGLFIIDFIMPFNFRWCFASTSTVVGISICAYILFIELFTKTFGWGLIYAIPFFLLFMTLYSIAITFSRNYYKGFEFITPLLIFTIISTVVFVFNYVKDYVFWPSLVAFLTSVVCFVFMLIFRFKNVKNELRRSFFM